MGAKTKEPTDLSVLRPVLVSLGLGGEVQWMQGRGEPADEFMKKMLFAIASSQQTRGQSKTQKSKTLFIVKLLSRFESYKAPNFSGELMPNTSLSRALSAEQSNFVPTP